MSLRALVEKRKSEWAQIGSPSPRIVKLEDKTEERENVNHQKEVFNAFSRMKSEGIGCDFVIKIGREKIPVHRAVLIASSKYYEAMLTHNTAEKKNGRVEIHGVELDAGKQCIDYMYTGKVKFSLKNPEDLIYAAELMQLPSLTDMYFEFLKEKLSAKNCLKYVQLAETFSRRSFAEFFKKSSAKNFAEIIESEDFLNISQSLLEECLVSSSGSGWDVEASKWKALLKWVNNDPKNRKDSFLQLFKMLKLENLTEDYLKNQVLEEPLVKNSMECNQMILNALLNSTKRKDGGGFDKKSAYIIACQSESRMLLQYEIKTKKCSRFARIPVDVYRKKLNIVSVRGEIYLTSGDAISKFINGDLIRLSATGHQPAYHQCAAHGTVIYIIFTDQTCKFDTEGHKWNASPVKLNLSDGFFVTSSDKFIYAMGGTNTSTRAAEFDFKSEKWEPITRMRFGRSYGAAVWSDQKVYALGGSSSNEGHEIEYYCPEQNFWALLSSNLKCSHLNCEAFSVSGKVYIVGSNRGQATTSTSYGGGGLFGSTTACPQIPKVAEIDLKTSTYREITAMKTDTGLACVVYADSKV